MSSIDVLEPLTLDEERERLHLERKVERAFYEAGLALQTLRDKKLYRSTHKTFQDYCKDRFGFTKRSAYYLIDTVQIVDNLQKSEPMVHIMPTSERQCRPLKSLEPEGQREAWNKAVEKAKGKVPSSRIVKEMVNQIKGVNGQVKNNSQSSPKEDAMPGVSPGISAVRTEFIPLFEPKIGQRVKICSRHPLFPERLGTITQLPNPLSAVVELDNQQRELINLKDLEMQRIVHKNGKVTSPNEGINYTQGIGNEWYVRLDEETWNKLNQYAQKVGTATLGGALARLLESNES